MKLFEKCIFSPLFQPFTIYRKSSVLDFRLHSEYVSGTINFFAKGSFLMFDSVLDTCLTCLKKDKNCKKSVKELFLETMQLNNFEEISEKNSTEKWFSSVIFSKFCKKSRNTHQRCCIKKAVFKHFAIFTGIHLCWSLFLIKL